MTRRLLPFPALFVAGLGLAGAAFGRKEVVDDLPPLTPVPSAVAVMQVDHDARQLHYAGPARLRVIGGKTPIYELEDFDQARIFRLGVQSEAPLVFAPPEDGGAWSGSFTHDKNRLRAELNRSFADGSAGTLRVSADLAPVAVARPADWVKAGTVLYFGRAYPDKPITKEVPMALTVRMGSTTTSGGRPMSWKSDLDPATQEVITGALSASGTRTLTAEVGQKAERHSDRFDESADVPGVTSLFVSAATYQNLAGVGGAPWEDLEIGGSSMLMRSRRVEVVIQADDQLWTIPAILATAYGGTARYLIADDPQNPLILAAHRPGYDVRLMAIDKP